MTSVLAPIALFTYNRPLHVRRTIEALSRNALALDSDLIIFSDGPKPGASGSSVAEVRQYLRGVVGFRTINLYERQSNVGLARSIIDGVTAVCNQHERVIVLEDDIVTSPWFLSYMNQALSMYEADVRVASIHGYCYPVRQALPDTFFLRGADCWGWATWRRSWNRFEQDGLKLLKALREQQLTRLFDLGGAYAFSKMLAAQVRGRNDSWAVRWHASCFLNDMLTLYPGRSLVQNIGTDGTGTHCAASDEYDQSPTESPVRLERISLEPSAVAEAAFARFLRGTRKSFIRRAIPFLMRYVRRHNPRQS